MTSIAIVGVGAIGSVVAAHLFAAGKDPLLCTRTPSTLVEVDTPTETLRVNPRWAESADAVEPASWIILATKAHQTAGASDWLRALASPTSKIAVLQNGVEHEERVSPFACGAELVPVVVECPCSRDASGKLVQRSSGTSMLSDRRAGQALESDARNGAVVRIGARHGIPTPVNRVLATLLGAINRG